jgi:antitoxin StbD
METIFADKTISMSEFKKNPASVLREAKHRPVAVLNHNRPAFYMIEPGLFEVMVDELADRDLYHKVLARLGEKAEAFEVDVDEI